MPYKKTKRFYPGGLEVPGPDCELITHGKDNNGNSATLAKVSGDSIGDNQITDLAHHQHNNNDNRLTLDIAAPDDGDESDFAVNDVDTFSTS